MPKTLLLADDSVVIQKLVGLSFANEDVKLVTTDNGDDALSRARSILPDLILADVVMPGKNGYEVCEAIKADPQLCRTPVLLLTGTFEAFDEERARRVGADGHITKPFEAQGLVDRVTELLARERPPTPAANTSPGKRGASRAAATPGTPPAVPAAATDETYDFFDEDVSELAEVAQPALAGLTDDDAAFEFGSSEFEPLSGSDDDPLSGRDFDSEVENDLDLRSVSASPDFTSPDSASPDSASADYASPDYASPDYASPVFGPPRTGGRGRAGDDRTIAVSPPATARATSMGSPRLAPPPLDATVIAEDFGAASFAQTAETELESDGTLEDDLFARALEPQSASRGARSSSVPVTSAATRTTVLTGSEFGGEVAVGVAVGSADDAFEFGFEPKKETSPMRSASASPATPSRSFPQQATVLDAEPEAFAVAESAFGAEPEAEATLESDVVDGDSSWDVSVSDLGQPLRAVEIGGAVSDPTSPRGGPDLSPMLRDRIHETLEKVAWEAFADLSDTIVRQVLQRVESTVWEIVPQMAETLIQEEIRRMKDGSE